MLVVEDSEESLSAMADHFSLYEANVSISTNAAQGLESAQTSQFDLVITDVNMPNLVTSS